MILHNKVAVVYGAGGSIGGAVARSFASEGAHVFLTGHRRAPVDSVAAAIKSNGGSAEVAEVDALDEHAIDSHIQAVVDKMGRIDVSFNAIGVPSRDILGTPFVELDLEKYMRPIRDFTKSNFLTARAAARHMIPKKSGVIMLVTSLPARYGSRLNGGYGPAQGAKDALTRDLSAELAPLGIRVVGLRPHGILESATMRELYDVKGDAMGITWGQFGQYLGAMTHTKRATVLDDVGGVAAFVASDKASGMTGTIVNLTMGSLDD